MNEKIILSIIYWYIHINSRLLRIMIYLTFKYNFTLFCKRSIKITIIQTHINFYSYITHLKIQDILPLLKFFLGEFLIPLIIDIDRDPNWYITLIEFYILQSILVRKGERGWVFNCLLVDFSNFYVFMTKLSWWIRIRWSLYAKEKKKFQRN